MKQYSGGNAPKNVNCAIKSGAGNAGARRITGGSKPKTQNSVKRPASGGKR